MGEVNFFEVVLIALIAVYRITFMLNSEDGPGHVFRNIRERIGVQYDDRDRPTASNWFAEGVLCFYCLSVWIGILATLFIAGVLLLMRVPLSPIEVAAFPFLPFALSGGAIFLYKLVG